MSLEEEICESVMERWFAQFHGKLKVMTFQNCFNVNDILREVATRRLLQHDFILIDNVATFCSSNLANQLPAFKSRLRQNKNNVLTLLYSPVQSRECSVIGVQSFTNKLVVYNSYEENRSQINISKNLFITDTVFHSDVSPCGIAICALEFADHFVGNYDFQTFDGIIHDIITNEEFLMQNIHVEIITDMTAFSANDYPSLLKAHSLLIKKKAYPLTFDNILPYFKDFDRLECKKNDVYIPAGDSAPSTAKDSVFGKGSDVDKTASIDLSSFGINAKIGEGTKVTSSICGDSVKIGNKCVIDGSILQNNVCIGDGVQVSKNCIIGSNVVIPSGSVLESGSISQTTPPPTRFQKDHSENENNWYFTSEQTNGYYIWRLCKRARRPLGHRDSISSTASSISKNLAELNHDDLNDSETVDVIYQGNNSVFLSEVKETMLSILRLENFASKEQVEKMKLEINASKLAYNVAPDDLSKNIFLAFIDMSADIRHSFKKISELFKQWNVLWLNYYKRDSSKTQFLHAIEEYAAKDEQFFKIVPKFLQFLFNDEDFLPEEVIVEWYENLPNTSSLTSSLKPLIDWIQEEEGDSSEDED
uniref:W2 domain-containing protein n=1 Tax=Ditylenchus dipsaci TaxID=166011 RepID=A0A915D7I2_9BILA